MATQRQTLAAKAQRQLSVKGLNEAPGCHCAGLRKVSHQLSLSSKAFTRYVPENTLHQDPILPSWAHHICVRESRAQPPLADRTRAEKRKGEVGTKMNHVTPPSGTHSLSSLREARSWWETRAFIPQAGS